MKRKIFVAIPNYTNTLRGEVFDSMLASVCAAQKEGWQVDTMRIPGRIHHIARNILYGHAVAGGYTDLFWWDDDVTIDPNHFVPFVKHDVPFVVAAYRHKRPEESYPGEFPEVGQRKMRESNRGVPLFNTLYWVIGLSRMTRECFEPLAKRKGVRWEIDAEFPDVPIPEVFQKEDGFIESATGRKRTFGEDYAICRDWIDLAEGNEVWLDPALPTGHTGLTTFWGCIGNQMVKEVEEYRRQIALDAVNKKINVAQAAPKLIVPANAN